MLELFYTEPKIANPTDGYCCYEVTDELDTTLRFGIDVIQQSVQIDLKFSRLSIVIFTFELVEAIEIINAAKGKFAFAVAPNSKELLLAHIDLVIWADAIASLGNSFNNCLRQRNVP